VATVWRALTSPSHLASISELTHQLHGNRTLLLKLIFESLTFFHFLDLVCPRVFVVTGEKRETTLMQHQYTTYIIYAHENFRLTVVSADA
jgi:hypothetical protein